VHALIFARWRTKVAIACRKEEGTGAAIYKLQEAESQASLLESCLKSLCTVGLLLGYSPAPGTMAVSSLFSPLSIITLHASRSMCVMFIWRQA
jgi:hypothetical protein